MSAKRVLALVLVLAAAVSCRKPGDQRTDTMDPVEAMQRRENLPVEVVAQLDSGSASFRAQDLEEALRHYQIAVDLSPDVAAGWFGVYMAHHALGHDKEAEEALAKAQSLVPGATLIHPTTTDTTP